MKQRNFAACAGQMPPHESKETKEPGMINGYLVAAYGFVCGIFLLYAWIIYARRKRVQGEIAELKSEPAQQGGKDIQSLA